MINQTIQNLTNNATKVATGNEFTEGIKAWWNSPLMWFQLVSVIEFILIILLLRILYHLAKKPKQTTQQSPYDR